MLMAYIRCHGLTYNEDGSIKSGSASLLESVYIKDAKYHSKQVVRERLGKVIFLAKDKKSGIFLSPTRGLVAYDARTDTFTPVNDEKHKDQETFSEVHKVFGDAYLILCFMEKNGLLDLLKDVFTQNAYKRVLCHLLYDVLRNGRQMTCEEFIENSFASDLFDDLSLPSLVHDEAYYKLMGKETIKERFFQAFIKWMRKKDPEFGQGCYVDTQALPYEMTGNPFNALNCHGNPAVRLVMILDEKTRVPLWYEVIDGDPIDLYAINEVVKQVAKKLNVRIDAFALGRKYAFKELFQYVQKQDSSVVVRMPFLKDYPYKALYEHEKVKLDQSDYRFSYDGHLYFGDRVKLKLFDQDLYAYVYVDRTLAMNRYRAYLFEHEEEYTFKNDDPDYLAIRFGYFVLLSNVIKQPIEILNAYMEKANDESLLKSDHDDFDLSEEAWTNTTVRGMLLSQIMKSIVIMLMEDQLKKTSLSFTSLINKTTTLMSSVNRYGTLGIESASPACKECFERFGLIIPAHIKMKTLKKKILK